MDLTDAIKEDIRITDKGIHCTGCEATIERFLSRVPGIERVKANEKTQLVSVTVDPEQVSVDQVSAKLDDLGYTTVR